MSPAFHLRPALSGLWAAQRQGKLIVMGQAGNRQAINRLAMVKLRLGSNICLFRLW
jgi:hypothetical protein